MAFRFFSPCRSSWLWWLLSLRLFAGTFQVGLDQDTVEAGGTAMLVYNFSDFGNIAAPPAPVVPGADVSYLGASSQSSVSIVNGRASRQDTLQHRYGIVPKQVGTLTIPASRFTAAGQQFTTPAMQITVTKGTQVSDIARLVLVTPTNTLYVGQPFLARIQFWFRQQPAQSGSPTLPTDGFVSGRSVQAKARSQKIGNEAWAVSESLLPLTPARAGNLPVGPAQLETIYHVGPRRGGFFGDMFAEQRRFSFTSSSNFVEVIPPPTEGQPPGFNGAIGRFSLSVTAQPTTVTVGDPITVRVTVQGQGSLETLTLPDFPADSGFRTYAGTNGFQIKDLINFRGTKEFELAVVPDRADLTSLQLPPLVSFDPETRQYIIAKAPAVPIQVVAGDSALAAPSVTPTYAANTETNQGPVTAAQLKPLGKGAERTVTHGSVWPYQPWYWGTLVTPFLGLAGWTFASKLLQRRRIDPEALRRAAAEARAHAAWTAFERSQGPESYTALDNALRERMAQIANLAPSAVGPDTIDEILVPRGLDEDAAKQLRRLLKNVETSRFSPATASTATAELRRDAEAAIGALRKLEAAK